MNLENHAIRQLRSRPRWAYVWHVWKVIVPRRSITGRLVYGRVLRRHNGRRWIYKRFAKCDPRVIDRSQVISWSSQMHVALLRDTWMNVNYLQIFRRIIYGSRACPAEEHLAAAPNFFGKA